MLSTFVLLILKASKLGIVVKWSAKMVPLSALSGVLPVVNMRSHFVTWLRWNVVCLKNVIKSYLISVQLGSGLWSRLSRVTHGNYFTKRDPAPKVTTSI